MYDNLRARALASAADRVADAPKEAEANLEKSKWFRKKGFHLINLHDALE